MTKLFTVIAFMMLVNTLQGQKLRKGSLISIKVMEIQLIAGKSVEEFKTFYMLRVIPAYEKSFEGLTISVLTSIRGEYKDELAVIWIFESEAARNKYFNDQNSNGFTDAGRAAMESLKDIRQEMNTGYGSWKGIEQDDWIVQ